MQSILFAVFCCVSYCGTEKSNPAATLTLISPPQSNWEEFTTSHQALKEATKAKKDNFTCVLNILKTALSEELTNSPLLITEETIKDPVLSSISSILEEEQLKKETKENSDKSGIKSENEIDAENALYQKIITKIASAFSKPQNVTNKPNNVETPHMIPIFKPRQKMPNNEIKQKIPDFNPAPITRPTPKSRAISFIPEKIIQTNMNPIPSQPMFNIPCQRAADILDMTNIAIPKETVGGKANIKPNTSPIVEAPKSILPSQIPSPETLSVNCVDSDDTVAMLFKPRNISLMQVYGNLMKKITITVLVPYHMSKLGGK